MKIVKNKRFFVVVPFNQQMDGIFQQFWNPKWKGKIGLGNHLNFPAILRSRILVLIRGSMIKLWLKSRHFDPKNKTCWTLLFMDALLRYKYFAFWWPQNARFLCEKGNFVEIPFLFCICLYIKLSKRLRSNKYVFQLHLSLKQACCSLEGYMFLWEHAISQTFAINSVESNQHNKSDVLRCSMM